MSGVIEEISAGDGASDRHDEALQNLLAQHGDDPAQLLATVFGFLQRTTGFLAASDAQRRVTAVLRRTMGLPDASASSGVKAGFLGAAKPAASKRSTAATTAAATATAADSATASAPPAASVSPSPEAPAAPAPEPEAAAATADDASPMEDEKDEASKGLKPNVGNGHDHDTYAWTQTLGDVSLSVPVPDGTKGRSCDVSITRTRLKVGLKGQPPILEGELPFDVKPDDSMWNLADGRLLELSLAKQDAMRWWPHVLQGEPQINIQKVEPENSKLQDLDGDTRAIVEKMMFDQRQKQMGLPTSDDSRKQEMLQKFMKAHPEMDFSNAKIG